MKCEKCGLENPADAKFCRGCGNGLPEDEAAVEKNSEDEALRSIQITKARKFGIAAMIFMVLSYIGCIGEGIYKLKINKEVARNMLSFGHNIQQVGILFDSAFLLSLALFSIAVYLFIKEIVMKNKAEADILPTVGRLIVCSGIFVIFYLISFVISTLTYWGDFHVNALGIIVNLGSPLIVSVVLIVYGALIRSPEKKTAIVVQPPLTPPLTPPLIPQPSADVSDELIKLKKLYDCGALTDDEYESQRTQLLKML